MMAPMKRMGRSLGFCWDTLMANMTGPLMGRERRMAMNLKMVKTKKMVG